MVLMVYINPEQVGGIIRCPVVRLVHLKCPGCGSLRAIYSILHGDIVTALKLNFLAVILLPVIFISLIIGIISGEDKLFTAPQAKLFIMGFIVFCFS